MDENARLGLINLYRGHLWDVFGPAVPDVSTGDELIALLKAIPTAKFEADLGVRCDPPFPGACEPPEQMPTGWRAICACRVFDGNDREAIVLYTTFVSGRRPTMVYNPAGTVIPDRYLPLAAR